MTHNIPVSIPVELTSVLISKVNPAILKPESDVLAAELHNIITSLRQLFQVRPPVPDEPADFLEADIILTVWNTALNRWPWPHGPAEEEDGPASAVMDESVWVACVLEDIGDDGSLYERYLKVASRVGNIDYGVRP